MNAFIKSTGLWSAFVLLTALIIWIISFAGIAARLNTIFWNNLSTDQIIY